MAKRFTDSNKWKHPSFTKLTNEQKLVWLYLLDDCDHAGIWLADFALLKFILGINVDELWMNCAYGERVQKISDIRFFIPGFLEFQYGNILNPLNKTHASVLRSLENFNIKFPNIVRAKGLGLGASKGLGLGLKDKDKDKDMDIRGGLGGTPPAIIKKQIQSMLGGIGNGSQVSKTKNETAAGTGVLAEHEWTNENPPF